MADVLTKQKTEAVSSAVSWDTTKVSNPTDAIYAEGKTRTIRTQFTIRSADSGSVTIGTIAEGHRPAADFQIIVKTGDDLKAVTFGADGGISIYAPTTRTFTACLTYLVP